VQLRQSSRTVLGILSLELTFDQLPNKDVIELLPLKGEPYQENLLIPFMFAL
jgi:hypothetical protein